MPWEDSWRESGCQPGGLGALNAGDNLAGQPKLKWVQAGGPRVLHVEGALVEQLEPQAAGVQSDRLGVPWLST